MKIKKLLSVLIIGGSMALLAQSAFAASQPVVSPSKQPEVQVQSSSTSASKNMWFDMENVVPGEYIETWEYGAIYEAYSSHDAILTVYQEPTYSDNENFTIRYRIAKLNDSWNSETYLVSGRNSQKFEVYLPRGTYFVTIENIGRAPADVYGTLGAK